MSLRFHEIAESDHRILNPLSMDKLSQLIDGLDLNANDHVLDLACGKGEWLVQLARMHGIRGVGVDISEVFLAAAKDRAYHMDVGDKLQFVHGDAADYPEDHHAFNLVACLGATWIGGGLAGTLDLMRSALHAQGGLLLVGEVFWHQTPSQAIARALDVEVDTFASLGETLARFHAKDLKLIEMFLASKDDFDRYMAPRWRAVHEFLRDNPHDTDADALQDWIAANQQQYMQYGRDYMGWGAFVLQAGPGPRPAPRIEQASDPVRVEIDDMMIWVWLRDGRVIGNPLSWYDWLYEVSPEDRERFTLSSSMIEWPLLEKWIRVADMLAGR
jgi:SAM-dependent methyltransferase